MRILFLSAWYPHRYDAMWGLFVRKHAQAVALYDDVCVLYVHPNESENGFDVVEQSHGNLHEIIVYFPTGGKSVLRKLFKAMNYLRAYRKGYRVLKSNDFTPDIVHVNILTRTGVMAYLYKKWKKTPYVITEHWTRYLPQNPNYNGFFRKKLTELVVGNASAVLPVSADLRNAMQRQNLKNSNYVLINNVVEDMFFAPPFTPTCEKKRILHISCFYQQAKNMYGLLRATAELARQRTDFELILLGTGVDFERSCDLARTLNFPDGMITFTGEQTPEEVALWFRNCDFFVLFSNYETCSVVVSESLAAGKPVVSTNLDAIAQKLNSSNGILVEVGNETQLTEQMSLMLDSCRQYDAAKIQADAQKYSYLQVGKHIHSIYTTMLS